MYDLIIIGGGPAGITAGIYGARQRLNTLLITKDFGGQVARKAVSIENYPGFEEISGQQLIQRFEKHLRRQKIDIERDEAMQLKKLNNHFIVFTGNKNKFESKTVIIASGADPRPLEIPGEKEFLGRGLSYCCVCDGPLFPDKTAAVIGGGNTGFEAAIFLSKIAKKIYILETGPEVKANKENQERVKETGKIEIITNAFPKEIRGEQFVNSLIYEDRKTGKTITLLLEGIFVEIGSQPATSFTRAIAKGGDEQSSATAKGLVDFNERDEIKVEFETYQTKTPGLFAAGDVNVGKFKQIITAAGEGAKAALAAYDYLEK